MNQAARFDHIVLLAPPWGPIEHRPHHLIKAIIRATECKVLYVEDRKDEVFTAWLRPWSLVRRIEPKLFVMKRIKVMPFESKMRWASRMNRRVLGFAIRLISKIIGLGNIVQWHWTAYTHEYVGMTDEKLVVYDGACETSLYSQAPPHVRMDERDLLHKADLAFTATEALREIASEDSQNAFVIANAVDSSRIQRGSLSAARIPSELSTLRKPVLGFIGNIHEWIDGSMIKDVALLRPYWEIVIIGPVRNPIATEKEIQKMKGITNIHMLGPRPYDVLADYLAAFDVCIIPYKITRLTSTAETLKFYEYLTTGKPIISTPLPMLAKWSDVVYLASTPEEFVACAESALNESKSKSTIRLELAGKNTWDDRAASVIHLLNQVWARKSATSEATEASAS